MKTFKIVQINSGSSGQVSVYCDSFIVFDGSVIFLSLYGTTVAVKSIVAQIISNRGGIYLKDEAGNSINDTEIELKRDQETLRSTTKNIKPGVTQKILYSENLFFPWKNNNSRILAFGETEEDAVTRSFDVIEKLTTIPLKASWKNWLWEKLEDSLTEPIVETPLKAFGFCKILSVPSNQWLEDEIVENLETLRTM